MQKTIVRRSVSSQQCEQLQDSELHPVLQRIFAARGISSAQEIEYTLKHLLPYHDLLNIDKAAQRIARAITEQQTILIVGDFDADGATSCAVAVTALTQMGAMHVDYLVPNRFEYGYGLTPEIVEVASQSNPHLLITVDNGIASLEGVARANSLGIDVVVTDHHLAPPVLPDAYAIVNPNQPGCTFASKNLAGVGVIFYVMLAVRAQLRESDWFAKRPQPNLAECLDLVALGTVADVVPLDFNNRILVHQGLARIRALHTRPGILALCEVSKRQVTSLSSTDLAFALGPRLNAAGRLDDISVGISCLLTSDRQEAREIAQALDTLNRERKTIESSMQREALHILEQMNLQDDVGGIAVYQEDWHQGVIGILASRIKDKFHKPVIAFAKAQEGLIKGSARSIPGLHIRDLLSDLDTAEPDLIEKFGGHAMAAGLSIREHHFARFSNRFNEMASRYLESIESDAVLHTDGALEGADFSMTLAKALREAGPWGQAFPEPLFDNEFHVIEQKLLKDKHLKMTLRPVDSDMVIEAIAFFVDRELWPDPSVQKICCAYRLDINEYQGRQSLQLLIEQM